MRRAEFQISSESCIGCGACMLLCPGVFAISAGKAWVKRRPINDPELSFANTALLNCPTQSIRQVLPGEIAETVEAAEPATGGLYEHLARTSESVRWRLTDVHWDRLDPQAAGGPLRALVHEMAFSEHTTYSATQRFMQAFEEDIEFSQWISVWFYEETRHPHILTAWLNSVGSPPTDPAEFITRGRVSTPFMKSKMGTLVTNIVSERTAAAAYASMARLSEEPVLRQIAGCIAGDEARHAASFFRFARRRLEDSRDTERERLDAMKVLHFWMNEAEQVSHPINQMLDRLQAAPGGGRALSELDFDFAALKRRITLMVGLLIDRSLRTPEDVLPALKEMTADRHRQTVGWDGGEAAPRA